jgi:hypothetical protein
MTAVQTRKQRKRNSLGLALGLGLCALLGLGCRSTVREPPSAEPAASGAAGKALPKSFGAPLKAGAPTQSLAGVLEQPEQFAGKSVIVEGEVRRACSRKGCWMELSTSKDAAAPGCRVTFKDYGFFVPTDSAGSSARVEAAVEVARLDPSHVAHLEREGATFARKAADGSAQEVRLVATGVELWR